MAIRERVAAGEPQIVDLGRDQVLPRDWANTVC